MTGVEDFGGGFFGNCFGVGVFYFDARSDEDDFMMYNVIGVDVKSLNR